jgi:hypothetical protein
LTAAGGNHYGYTSIASVQNCVSFYTPGLWGSRQAERTTHLPHSNINVAIASTSGRKPIFIKLNLSLFDHRQGFFVTHSFSSSSVSWPSISF